AAEHDSNDTRGLPSRHAPGGRCRAPELPLDLGLLQRARRAAIQARRDSVVAAAALEVSAREPGRAAMARRARPCRRGLRARDPLFRVLEPALVRERAPQDELS